MRQKGVWHPACNIKNGSFPRNVPPNLRKEVVFRVMKLLKQILFMSLLFICFSMTATAQKDDDKNRPKKDPPVIVAPDKDRPKPDRPRDDNKNRPKKPQDAIFLSRNKTEIDFA